MSSPRTTDSAAPAAAAPATEIAPSRAPIVGAVLGVPIMAYGLRGVFVDASFTEPGELGRWLVGAAVVHDLLFLPLVIAVGWLFHRVVPPGLTRRVISWCLATSGVLVLVAWPFVRGYGRRASNPSLLPRDYGQGLAVYVGVVWTIGAVVLVAAHRRRGRADDPSAGATEIGGAPP